MPRTYSVSSPLTARPCARPTSMMSSSTSTSSGPTSPLVVSIQVALLSPATTLTSGCSCYMETCALSRALSRLLVIDCSLHRSGCYHFENQADCTSCGYNSGPQRERRAFKQREPRPAGADVGPAEAAGLSVRRHLCWKGVAQRQNIPRPRAPSSPSIAVGRRLRPTTPRPCGSCAAALVARRRSPSRWSLHARCHNLPRATGARRGVNTGTAQRAGDGGHVYPANGHRLWFRTRSSVWCWPSFTGRSSRFGHDTRTHTLRRILLVLGRGSIPCAGTASGASGFRTWCQKPFPAGGTAVSLGVVAGVTLVTPPG